MQQDYTYQEDLYNIPDKTTVILAQPWNDVADQERSLLEKILGAVKLSLAAVRIIHQPAFNLASLQPKPTKMIYFGPAINGLAQYEVIEADGASVVMAGGLNELQQDDASKKKLWQALRRQYGI